jgi:Zn-finger nucleic acid-binding protein
MMEAEELKWEVVEVELKYCERCGGLWLRRRGTEEVYCRPCVPKMAECPAPRLKRAVVQVREEGVEIEGELDTHGGLDLESILLELLSLCEQGGNA